MVWITSAIGKDFNFENDLNYFFFYILPEAPEFLWINPGYLLLYYFWNAYITLKLLFSALYSLNLKCV